MPFIRNGLFARQYSTEDEHYHEITSVMLSGQDVTLETFEVFDGFFEKFRNPQQVLEAIGVTLIDHGIVQPFQHRLH